jgi:hypothetical protein
MPPDGIAAYEGSFKFHRDERLFRFKLLALVQPLLRIFSALLHRFPPWSSAVPSGRSRYKLECNFITKAVVRVVLRKSFRFMILDEDLVAQA